MKENNFASLDEFQTTIGYRFKDISLLTLALTHSSFANETKSRTQNGKCNERLEFLGDSVLSFLCAEYIYTKYPDMPEGNMSKLRACAVESASLAEYSTKIGVGKYLLLGHGEDTKAGRGRTSTLENAFEALTAAIFLDGGLVEAAKFAMPFLVEKVKEREERGDTQDFKTKLQQIVQMERGERLEYVKVSESGPDHDKTYVCEARLNSNVIGVGEGKSKKAAEQIAAMNALRDYFGIDK